jgi:hypothetical protein
VIAGPHTSAGSGSELKKDFDASIKGNVYFVEGHKVIMPAVNSAAADSNKNQVQTSQTGKLDIIHRYLVIQIFLASGDPFSCELHVKDKNNVYEII